MSDVGTHFPRPVHICPVCKQPAEPVPDSEQPTTLGEPLDGPDIYSVADYERRNT